MSGLFSLTNDETKILIKILNMLILHVFIITSTIIIYSIITSFFKYLVIFIIFQYYCDLYNISIENL